MTFKRFTGLLCGAILIIQSICFAPLNFAASESVDQKANILNQMGVFSGDGTSYLLDKPLKRSEAAAVIVKALGLSSKVLQNKSAYQNTGFKDVPKTAWYAPYVGYCVQNKIITGMPDGTFKAEQNLSEKAFFTMMLKALGYSSGDYTWNGINRKAYEVGLISDIGYTFKEDDNTNYLRSGVVDVLYNSMSLKFKGQDRVFVEQLISNNQTTKTFAAAQGFLTYDQTVSTILTTQIMDTTTVKVTLNESVNTPILSDVKIYKMNTPTATLGIREVLAEGSQLTIKTESQLPGQKYVLEIGSIVDKDGNVAQNLKSDFTTQALVEVQSPYFKISKAEAINSKSVNLYFTHPVTEKAETELLYTINLEDNLLLEGSYRNIIVKKSSSNPKMITLTLKELSFVDGKTYTVKIKGDMVSSYQSYLNQCNGESISFVAQSGQNLPADVSNLFTQDGKYLVIDYSNKVDLESAMIKTNYSIKEKDTGRNVIILNIYTPNSIDRIGKRVVLKCDLFNSGKEYELTTRNIYNETKLSRVPDTTRTLMAGIAATQEFALEQGIAVDKYTVNLYMNKELTATSIYNNVFFDNGIAVAKKSWSTTDPHLLKLYINKMTPLKAGTIYKVTVSPGMADYTDYVLSKAISINIAGSDLAKQEVSVTGATFIEMDRILVTFNQEIDSSNNISDKFEVYHNDGRIDRLLIPENVSIVDSKTAIVKLPLLMAGGRYQLRCKNILDNSGQITTILNSYDILNEYFK